VREKSSNLVDVCAERAAKGCGLVGNGAINDPVRKTSPAP
jgi:hypothetical protein